MTLPHKNNACAGAYAKDWLEVHLLNYCNAKCSWCVENEGFKPSRSIHWTALAKKIKEHPATNIILLGGEPTFFGELQLLITSLNAGMKKVWLTTNGTTLPQRYVQGKLQGLYGLNISLHHYNMALNGRVLGLVKGEYPEAAPIAEAIEEVRSNGTEVVRFNCNVMRGGIDTLQQAAAYVDWSKNMGATNVRFAELKNDTKKFVSLISMFLEYGVPEHPFTKGCSTDFMFRGMPVNVRTMCGIQTSMRTKPTNPQQTIGQVMYQDGILYDGWQKEGPTVMADIEIQKLMKKVANGEVSPAEATMQVSRMKTKTIDRVALESGGGCLY